MITRHTPGPWHYDGGAQIVHGTETHIRVAFLPSDHYKYDCSKANGRLIAAAPDLLEYARLMAANGDPDAEELVAICEGRK